MFFRRSTQLPVADSTHCRCACHSDGENPHKPINGLVTPGVERIDAVGAATACSLCLGFHALALSGHPVTLDLRARHAAKQQKERDASTSSTSQADGEDED